MNEKRILECVSNFSEGRNSDVIQKIANSIRSIQGVTLLHIDTSPSANRTVITYAGEPEQVVEAAYQAISTASAHIDMRQQDGVHPRIGATDVCPLIPIQGISMDEVVALSYKLGARVGNELNIPIYLYERSASAIHRKPLPAIRKGQYEGMAEKMMLGSWEPDYGPKVFNPQTGATVIGARDILVAFNVSLYTKNVADARYIAKYMRESGFIQTKDNGTKERVAGLLPKVRAIGWYMDDFDCAQVSMNLLDYRVSSPLKVWETCKALAKDIGVEVLGSELIGLMPEECLLQAGSYAFMKEGKEVPKDKQLIVHRAIDYLALNKVKPFDPQEKVLEYSLQQAGLL